MTSGTAVTTPQITLVPRPVAESVDELLADATRRESFTPADARSPARFERVWIDGEPHVVKHVHLDHDFAMRSYGDVGVIPLRVWELGLMDVADDVLDHAVVGAAPETDRGAAILMRDVGEQLVPVGQDPITPEQEAGFLDHIAAVSARFWGWRDELGLVPYADRWRMFDRRLLAHERALGWPEDVPRYAEEGWALFAGRAPRDVADAIESLLHDMSPLATAIAATPSTFLHGDWKLGNLGTAPDGRTVLVDWAYCGEGPVCHELAWYLSLNRSRRPVGESREDATAYLRTALERRGIATQGWWDVQLDLALLGGLVLFGWEKAFGDDAELGWWCDAARAGIARL